MSESFFNEQTKKVTNRAKIMATFYFLSGIEILYMLSLLLSLLKFKDIVLCSYESTKTSTKGAIRDNQPQVPRFSTVCVRSKWPLLSHINVICRSRTPFGGFKNETMRRQLAGWRKFPRETITSNQIPRDNKKQSNAPKEKSQMKCPRRQEWAAKRPREARMGNQRPSDGKHGPSSARQKQDWAATMGTYERGRKRCLACWFAPFPAVWS